jgi:hypothetical protein
VTFVEPSSWEEIYRSVSDRYQRNLFKFVRRRAPSDTKWFRHTQQLGKRSLKWWKIL